MKPKVGQIWKFQHGQPRCIEYHMLLSYDKKSDRWETYNIETGEKDFDFGDQFLMDDEYWVFVQ